MSEATIQFTRTYRTQTCCHQGCGAMFALDTALDDRLRRTHERFYCPFGHGQSYNGESDAEKLKRELSIKARQVEILETDKSRLTREVQQERHAAATARGKHLALKKRVKNGVCPCCKRSFQNLRNHMKNEHPGFAAPENETDGRGK